MSSDTENGKIEAQLHLTSLGATRATWTKAAEIADKRAGEYFQQRKDVLAGVFRDLADVYKEFARAVECDQQNALAMVRAQDDLPRARAGRQG